jgi:hypothetical protein
MSSYHKTTASSPLKAKKSLQTVEVANPVIMHGNQSFSLNKKLHQLLHPVSTKHKKTKSDQIPAHFVGLQLPLSPRVLSKIDKDKPRN